MSTDNTDLWAEASKLLERSLYEGGDVRDIDTVLDALANAILEMPEFAVLAGNRVKTLMREAASLDTILEILETQGVVSGGLAESVQKLNVLKERVDYGYLPSDDVQTADERRSELYDGLYDLRDRLTEAAEESE